MKPELLEELPQDLRDRASSLLFLLSTSPYHEEEMILKMLHNFCGGNTQEIYEVATAALLIHFANPNRKA